MEHKKMKVISIQNLIEEVKGFVARLFMNEEDE
jgi:hypothetical protein